MSHSPVWIDACAREALLGFPYYWSRIISSGNGEIVYTSEMYDTEQAMMKTARKMAAALGCALCTVDGEWETP